MASLMKITLARIILCAAALVCTTAWNANAQNLVVNGGFETGNFNGWNHSGDANGFDIVGDVSNFAHSGAHYAALGSSPDPGSLEQSLNTIPGRLYTLQFFVANFIGAGGGRASSFEVFWNNESVYFTSSPPVSNYWETTLTVRASAGSSTSLRFVYTHTSDFWYLDDVSVTPVTALSLNAAVSRKTHGAAGIFDINLLTANFGPECRSSGGSQALVFAFSDNVVSGNASVTGGTGSILGSPIFNANTMTVNLTGVTDVQKVTITLSNVMNSFAQVLPNTAVSVNVLGGDVTGNKTVNASDVSQTKAESGQTVDATSFRADVSANGVINASDVSLVKSRSGAGLP
jgi:hypothetical protein